MVIEDVGVDEGVVDFHNIHHLVVVVIVGHLLLVVEVIGSHLHFLAVVVVVTTAHLHLNAAGSLDLHLEVHLRVDMLILLIVHQ